VNAKQMRNLSGEILTTTDLSSGNLPYSSVRTKLHQFMSARISPLRDVIM